MVRQEIGIRKKKDKKTEDADMGFGGWGGYMASKRAKLMDQFHDAKIESISNIFQGIAIHVNGLTKPPIDVLKNHMAAHGGLFHAYQVSSTTHIIASNLANVKVKKLGPVPIVKPSWITDSIDFGKLLDYRRYLLYTNQSLSQPKIQFSAIDQPSVSSSSVESECLLDVTKTDDIFDKKFKNIEEDNENKTCYSSHTKADKFECDQKEQPTTSECKREHNELDQKEQPSTLECKIEYNDELVESSNQNVVVDNKNLNLILEQSFHNSSSDKKETCFSIEDKNFKFKESDLEELIASDHDKNTEQLKSITTLSERTKIAETKLENTGRASTKTAADPNFLKEFYNNSRLHLISTLGAEYKQLVNQLREKSEGNFPGVEKLLAKGRNITENLAQSVIMHIDMDCFFVSVGLRNHPELRGKPVAVAHGRSGEISNIKPEQKIHREQEFALYSERLPIGVTSRVDKIDTLSSLSEIASCSYEARNYGLRNGMFLGQAVKMCPDLKILPYAFEGYKEVSHTLYNIIASYTLDIEAVSCDEMYVDISNILNQTGLTVEEWATYIRNEITNATGCPCSTGFGSNRLQARLATRKAKPAGAFYLKSENVEAYMVDIPLADLPGVGKATLTKLKNLGLSTCGDIQTISSKILQKEIGRKAGETLKEQACGIDKKSLNYFHERKSVSAEVNYGIRFKSIEECHNFLQTLSTEVSKRLCDINMKARCVTLKLLVRAEEAPLETAKFLGHGICDSISKSSTNVVINDSQTIFKEVLLLYNKINPCFTDLRGIGIQLSKLEKNISINSSLSNFLKQPSTKKRSSNNKSANENIRNLQNKLTTPSNSLFDAGEGTSTGYTGIERGRPIFTYINNTENAMSANTNLTEAQKVQIHIDPNVLRELPDEVRREVIAEYKLEKPDISAIGTEEERDATKFHIKQNVPDQTTSPFSDLDWDQMKPLIKRWVTSAEKPEELDTIMIGEHFKAYAINRKIELLFTIFNSLHRLFSNLSCEWHKAYFVIVNITQEGMLARYGNALMIKQTFNCCHN